MSTYTVIAERTSSGWWTLTVEGVGVSQVRRLDQAADEMREAIAMVAGVPESEVDVEVVPVTR